MRKLFVVLALVVASLIGCLGMLASSARPGPAADGGSSHFACIAAWNLGVCIGPPTS